MFSRLILLLAFASSPAWPAAAVPHLDKGGQAAYRAFQQAPEHRAFVIAPGGAFGWVAEKGGRDDAETEALARCQANTRQKCVPYAVDAETVFDAAGWPGLWGPYLSAEQARHAAVGRDLGQRFPDLAFTSSNGAKASVGALRGKVAILHFWGSWCAPCRREMPDMQKQLYARIRDRKDVALVLLQVRERFDVSRRWTKAQKIDLPLFDSGSGGEMDSYFDLVDGNRVFDRDIAARFPTTLVLDKHGIVVFAHVGPIHDWKQYEPFILDVAARSGK